jgi:hypothetical protein
MVGVAEWKELLPTSEALHSLYTLSTLSLHSLYTLSTLSLSTLSLHSRYTRQALDSPVLGPSYGQYTASLTLLWHCAAVTMALLS